MDEIAEDNNAALTRVVLSGLTRIAVPGLAPGMAALLHATVVAAGVDPSEVAAWVAEVGGHQAYAYMRPNKDGYDARGLRAPLHPETYFAVPVRALDAAPTFSTSGPSTVTNA
jgi:hypothetical protein